jgi:hypothetical protein
MVARLFPHRPTLLSRRDGLVVGIVSASVPAGACALLLSAWLPGGAVTLAVPCLSVGALIGATIGRGLAARPDPVGVLIVALIADIIGAALGGAVISLSMDSHDPIVGIPAALVIFGVPGFFFLAFPGVVIGIVVARRLAPGRA